MIHHIVQFALRQRFLILMLVVFLAVGGAVSFQHMPVDAYPDLSPPMVEIITQWPGHAAEEIERSGHAAHRSGNERRAEDVGDALDFALRAVRRDPDVRRGHRRLFRAASGVSAAERSHLSHGRDALARAALEPVGPGLSLCDREPRPHAAGTENIRRLGDRARIQAGARAWPTIPASAAR